MRISTASQTRARALLSEGDWEKDLKQALLYYFEYHHDEETRADAAKGIFNITVFALACLLDKRRIKAF